MNKFVFKEAWNYDKNEAWYQSQDCSQCGKCFPTTPNVRASGRTRCMACEEPEKWGWMHTADWSLPKDMNVTDSDCDEMPAGDDEPESVTQSRLCAGCNKPLPGDARPNKKTHNAACRQAAKRKKTE